jgi:hypothetical protein
LIFPERLSVDHPGLGGAIIAIGLAVSGLILVLTGPDPVQSPSE